MNSNEFDTLLQQGLGGTDPNLGNGQEENETPPLGTETPPADGDVPATGTGTETPPVPGTDDPNKPNPMRELRNQYKQTKEQADAYKAQLDKQNEVLEKYARSKGFNTVEELERSLQEEELKKTAAQKQLPIEVVKQLQEQENRLKQIEQDRIRENFNFRATRLQQENGLTNEQMVEFAEKARATGIDIFKPNVDLNTLYRALNYDNLVKSVREQERQRVLEEMKANKERSPQPNASRSTGFENQQGNIGDEKDFMSQLFTALK